jgi:hypothetical protein
VAATTTPSAVRPTHEPAALERWALRAAYLAVAVFLLYLLARLRAVLGATYANSDSASGLVLAELLGDKGSGYAALGDYRWLEPLYAMHLTRWLPSHRVAWELAPYAVWALTVAGTWWTVRRTASARAAGVVALCLAAPSPIVLGFVGVANAHTPSAAHTVLLSAFLVTLPGLGARSRPTRAAWALALAVTLAPGISDQVLLVGGVLGFLVAVAAGWRLGLVARGVALLAAGACVMGVAAGQVLTELAKHDGIRTTGKTFATATADQLTPHARLLLEGVALLAHGRLGGPLTLIDVVLELVGVAAMAGVAWLAFAARRPALALVRGATAAADGAPAAPQPPAARLLAVFWLAAIGGVVAAFVLTSAPSDIYTTRYVVLAWPGLLVLAVLLVPARRAVPALALLATLCAVLGVVDLARGTYTTPTSPFPQGREVGALEKLVAAEGLDHGYAAYWDAATITAQTDFKARVYPLGSCDGTLDHLCPSQAHHLQSWYVPKPGRVRTFYVLDDVAIAPVIGAPPTRLGTPARTVVLGRLHVFIYNYDIAGRLAR